MLLDIVLLVLGVALILWGADKLTDGSSALARRLNVSDTVIGLTVVAMGSSLPEFSVSLFSSLQGSGGMSGGNIVGSNLFNVLVIIGAVAAVKPLSLTKSTVRKDIPFTIVASTVLFLLAKDVLVDDGPTDILSRVDGCIMLFFFMLFLSYTYSLAKHKPALSEEIHVKEMSIPMIICMLLLGFACLIGGGELLVKSGTSLARALGVSETVIGLTILAGGTSLPEFAASLMAARKGSVGMAVGNVVGSCLFNIFFVLGVCSLVTPMEVNDISAVQFWVLIGSGVLMWLFSVNCKIGRLEGFTMCLVYVLYIVYLIAISTQNSGLTEAELPERSNLFIL